MEQKPKEGKKKQVLTLVIGILIGAILSSAVFLIFKPKSSRSIPDFSGFSSGEFDRSKMRNRHLGLMRILFSKRHFPIPFPLS